MITVQSLLYEISMLVHDGGWVFLALVALAFGIAFALISLWHMMRLPEAPVLASQDWLSLLRSGPGYENARARLQIYLSNSNDVERQLQELGQRLFSKPERRFPFAFILISAAPLIGLLGTVSGMFTTFRGMSATAAMSPLDVISDGISEALITTQTGLIIGVPTFIVCAFLKSRHDELVLRFQQLQSQLLQLTPS